ncbi:hypothetical protein, partial [Pseudochrobactrum kiredjianiae]
MQTPINNQVTLLKAIQKSRASFVGFGCDFNGCDQMHPRTNYTPSKEPSLLTNFVQIEAPFGGADLPLNFHPTAIRASAVLTTPIGVL